MEFKATRIEAPTIQSIRKACPDHETMLVTILDEILRRYEARPQYPFIDTKLSLLTGEDFGEEGFKGRNTIFGWIQARGLEALVGHARWLPECGRLSHSEKENRMARLGQVIKEVMEKMEAIRAINGGHIFFMHSTEGQPLTVDNSGQLTTTEIPSDSCNISDVFYAKGLFAAADYLEMKNKAEEAKEYFRRVMVDVEAGRLYSDQQSFDPKNTLEATPDKRSHVGWMLCLGGCSLFAERTGEPEWLERAAGFIRLIIGRHVNRGQLRGLQEFDFVEAVDTKGNPWSDEKGVISDAGHALEFVGFAAKCLLLMEAARNRSDNLNTLLDDYRTLLPKILIRNFHNAFNTAVGGICKAFDLLSRRTVNPDMPWWSLPETMRAAMFCYCLSDDAAEQLEALAIARKCSNGFFKNYINRDVHLMAYQTIGADGNPVDVIPATPDADPAYHTGLSIIDFLRAIGRS